MCIKLIFKRLLLKLITESTFIFNIKYYKQTDGCTMGGPLSVVFSDIYLTKLEKDAILPLVTASPDGYISIYLNNRYYCVGHKYRIQNATKTKYMQH